MSELTGYSSDFLTRLRDRVASSQAKTGTAAHGLYGKAAANNEAAEAPDPALVAAAISHVFTLENLPHVPDAAVMQVLARDSVPAPGFWKIRGRILSRARRVEVLNALGRDGVRDALRDSPPPLRTPTQEMFEHLVMGHPIDPPRLLRSSLVALREALLWVSGLMSPPFTEDDIDVAITQSDAWTPFRHLLDQSLVGRSEMMDDLSGFLGLRLGPDGALAQTKAPRERLLFMEGVGGIGKTALIAHFIARFRDDKGMALSPFAYLACDDPGFDVTETELMLTAAADQILRHFQLAARRVGHAFPREADAAYHRFMAAVRQQSDTAEIATKRSSTAGSLDSRLDTLREGDDAVTSAFADFADMVTEAMSGVAGITLPCLIVIDTFEEVRYRSAARLLPFWRLVEHLLEWSDSIRIIIVGRGPIPRPNYGFRAGTLALNELSREAAVDLLVQESGRAPESLERLARQIGGNPLNLRLAARVISDEAPGRYGIAGLSTRRWGIFRISEELIRGQLYRRVLDHIHDPRVRALAHPGMVLRRITPAIIESVLAPICDIDLSETVEVTDETGEGIVIVTADADYLFAELSKEHTLVRLADDQSLRYREDVRRPVLDLLTNDEPDLTRRVHEAAFDHYAAHFDDAKLARAVTAAEAIYHGLMLGREGDVLERFWIGDVNVALENAIDELPSEGKVWLAGKMDISLPENLYAEADTAQWERMVGPRALAVLQEAGSAEVLSLLSDRATRSDQSPITSIEARCLTSLGDFDAAEKLLTDALDEFPINGNPGRKAEYLWLLAKNLREAGDMERALDVLRDLAELAASLTSPIPLVQCLAAALGIAPPDFPALPNFRADLTDALMRCSDVDISREPDVMRNGFAAVDVASAPLLGRCALASLSGLYGIVPRREAFQPTAEHVAAILDIAREATTRPECEKLGNGLLSALNPTQLTTSDLLQSFDVLRPPLVEAMDGRPGPAAAMAAQVVWHLCQMETTSFATATLAGIDDYRMPWEVETIYQAAAV